MKLTLTSVKLRLTPSKLTAYTFLSCLIFLISGCSEPDKVAPIKMIYEKSAQYHQPDRNPIIVIPGILGSRLIDDDTGTTVWGAFDRSSADPDIPTGVNLLSLPIADSLETESCHIPGMCDLRDQRDNIRSSGVLDTIDVNLYGLPINFGAYANILATLGVGGYRDESLGLNGLDYGDDHFTCFQFDYDWRRDNVENAQKLKRYIDEKKAYVRAEYKKRYGIDKADIKFDIVAHSMGGLLTRYFLRYGDQDLNDIHPNNIPWAGAKDIGRVILIGTPNAGSLDAYKQLVEGFDIGRPFLPFYQASLLGTYPSIYQLLPRPRHQALVWRGDKANQKKVDIYDSAIWEKYGWGLASKEFENLNVLRNILPTVESADDRRKIALAQQARILKRTKLFHEAIDQPASPPKGTEIFLVAGDTEHTLSKITLSEKTGEIINEKLAPGDGSVLRSSVLMDERIGGEWTPQLKTPISWKSVLLLSADHLGLTADPSFKDNVLFWLLEDVRS